MYITFIQLVVALNFGLVYLDCRLGLVQLKRKFFSKYKASDNVFVNETANILKRYFATCNIQGSIMLAVMRTVERDNF